MDIGVDIENIKRFKRFTNKKNSFLQMVFTQKELDYCFSKANAAPHLAVRFCGKEATLKATSSLVRGKLALNQIEISHDNYGVPKAKILDKKYKKFLINISLAHSGDTAIAFVAIN